MSRSNLPASDAELARTDAVALADLIREGYLSQLRLYRPPSTESSPFNGDLNAVIHKQYEKALDLAASPDLPDGPFRGVPMLIKDLGPQRSVNPITPASRP
ncbi:MAG: hypothetical protein CM1200mP26_09060 [Acidimicrobiales bacterium]|nr:MAG: hypothetical protein CM1200mP26_09060 [Acidimicrobiales bacterium]